MKYGLIQGIKSSIDGYNFHSKMELFVYEKLSLYYSKIEVHKELVIYQTNTHILKTNIDFYLPSKNQWIEVKGIFDYRFNRLLQEILTLQPELLPNLLIIAECRNSNKKTASSYKKICTSNIGRKCMKKGMRVIGLMNFLTK